MQTRVSKPVPAGATRTSAAPASQESAWQPQVFQSLLHSGVIQAKLTVSQPGDPLEQEADQVADEVMRMPAGSPSLSTADSEIQRKCACGCKEDEPRIQAKEATGRTPSVTPQAESHIESLRGGGQPLPDAVRSFFEPRFGRDFSGVRIHSDSRANEAASAVQARAFTIGKDVVFGNGEYAPQSAEGQRLLAHELAHTVQQTKAPTVSNSLLQRKESDDSQLDVWGGFRIGVGYKGDTTFIPMVRADLNRLNATSQGAGVLAEINNKLDHWYSRRINIVPAEDCVFKTKGVNANYLIRYNRAGCPVNPCPGENERNERIKWRSVPNFISLFHEIVHAYLYHVKGMDTESDDFECKTVGLGDYFDKIPYNENKLRCELNLPIRPCYGGQCLGMKPPTCPSSQQPDQGPEEDLSWLQKPSSKPDKKTSKGENRKRKPLASERKAER